MGVHGLWKLIDAAGKPVPVETLENRVLAVDVSIWLHQLVKGFQDSTGGSGANAHLLGLFYRICKLLFFRIKPVFVFDGGVPALKRKTIAARQSNRSKASESLEKIRQELLQNLLKQHALGKILGEHVKIPKSLTSKQDNMFFLPPLPSSSSTTERPEATSTAWDDSEDDPDSDNDSDSSYEEHSPRKKYGDIHSIDVNSKEFKALPADIRHDILSELKETRKQNSWAKVHLMPEDVGDFSSFQMERLLKRRSVQVGLEDAEKEMGPRCFTVSEIQEILEYQGLDVKETQSERIASDSTTRFIYATQKSPEKEGKCKMETVTEELSTDEDDPLLDALKANEDLSQEDILKIIREEEAKKKFKELLEGRGKTEENINESQLDEIRNQHQTNLEPGKILQESTTSTKQKTFDNKLVGQLLKDRSLKSLLPISKVHKVLEGRKRKPQRKKVVRKVSAAGPNLSESSSDSDVPEKLTKSISSDSEEEVNKVVRTDKLALHSEKIAIPFESSNKVVDSKINTETLSIKLSSEFSRESSEKSSGSSDDDFEEVPVSKNDSSSTCNFLNPSEDNSLSKLNRVSHDTVNSYKQKNISIELNFDKPPSDEEDIFAGVFETPAILPKSNIRNNEYNKETDSFNNDKKRSVAVSSAKDLSIDINLDKPPSDEEDIFTDVFANDKEVNPKSGNFENLDSEKLLSVDSKITPFNFEESKSTLLKTSHNVSNIKSEHKMSPYLSDYVDPKEAERAVILEELLLTKKKLEEELEPDASLNVDIESMSNIDEIKEPLPATQESIEEKGYFTTDDNLVKDDEVKSPNSFAKKLNTVEQVRQFQSTLERESSSLIKEKRRDEKIAATLSEQITIEAQELLKMFGIPFMVAPMEAEAQCAFLDSNGLTQGTITDDSDIWLFGANNVYKNFFDQKKYVKLFKSSDIRKVYNLGRDDLIMLGLLVGSDYTSGLNGVGPVTALEILADFPQQEDDVFPSRDRLSRFASAFTNHRLPRKLTKKLLPVQLIEGFPSLEVVRAYTDPQIDESKETFSWGHPNMERIREYAIDKFGWDPNKTDKTLEPIIDKLQQSKTQTTLHGFFDWAFDDIQGKMSKRVESAVNLLGTSPEKRAQQDVDNFSTQEVAKKKAKGGLTTEKSKRKKAEVSSPCEADPSTSTLVNEDISASQDGSTVAQEDISAESLALAFADDFSEAGPSSSAPFSSNIPSSSKSKKKDPGLVSMLSRINATIQKLKKGQSLSSKPRTRVARETSVSLTKPLNELDFDAPFGTGEARKRKKVYRTDEEKWREIEEARAKAARVIAKLKNVDQFHGNR